MPKQPYGQRDSRYIAKPGEVAKTNRAWLDFHLGRAVILVGDQKTSEVQPGEDVVLFFPRPGRVPDFSLPLTDLTREELDKFHELVELAFTWAGPIVDLRDEVAQDAFQQGNDSIIRLYRRVPNLVIKSGPSGEYSDRVHERPEAVSGGGRGVEDSDGELRSSSEGVAGGDSHQARTEDDSETKD